MTKPFVKLPLAVLVAAVLSGPGRAHATDAGTPVSPGGPPRSEVVPVSAFTAVDVAGHVSVTLKPSPTQRVTVEGAPLARPGLSVTSIRGVLTIRRDPELAKNEHFRLTIETPPLESLRASGAASVDGTVSTKQLALNVFGGGKVHLGLKTTTLQLSVSGGSATQLQGSVKQAIIQASGGATLHAERLYIGRAEVRASGGAQVHVLGASVVDGKASGGSLIEARDSAAVAVATSGGAQLKQSPPPPGWSVSPE